jgi:hypothetical protein
MKFAPNINILMTIRLMTKGCFVYPRLEKYRLDLLKCLFFFLISGLCSVLKACHE